MPNRSRGLSSKVFLAPGVALLAAGAATLLPARAAHAQVPVANPLSAFRFKAGGYFADGEYSPVLGASFDFNRTRAALVVPVAYSLYVDAAFGNHDFVGVGASFRAYVTPVPIGSARFYAGAGLGYYARDDNGLGGKIFAGAEFAQRLFGEFAFQRPGGDARNGVELSLGVRF
jgi:hypothetical protein